MGATPLDDLRADIASGQAVVIVGAGVSMAATGKAPAASWTGLLEDGVAYCDGLLGPRLPARWAERRRDQLGSEDTEELISAAEDITRRLGGPGGGEYGRWLAQSVGRLEATRPEVLDALAALRIPLATTNYDGLLEQATELSPVTWRDGAKVEQVLRGDRQAVLHLHGHWEDPDSVVLGIRSYEAVLTDAHAEAMRKALAATRTLVFVGCGAGLADPNFGELRRWLAGVFAASRYRHYRLGLEEELAELWREHGLDERIVPIAYGTGYDELVPFLRSLRAVPPSAPSVQPVRPPPTGPRPSRLPPPPRCFGRDAIVEDLVATLLTDPPPPTPVLGPAGVGKSTVCLAALHEPRVAERYGERRWFVRCNAAENGEAVLAEVAAALSLPVGPDLAGQALAHLAQAPAVVVLDNAEMPWWADASGAEEIFATLAAVPGLALVASLRGRQRPFGLAWRDAIDVAPLASPEARKVFLAVAGQAFQHDPHLDLLVGAQDGLPLTTTLLAYQAEGEPTLEPLWNRWTERRLALLERGVGGTEVSVQASFDLSINSDRMTDESRRLLSLLGVLADGIAHDDLDALLPGAGGEAATRLRKIGLAFDAGSRLRTLQPIRDHVQAAHPPWPDDLARTVAHYCQLAETLGWQLGRASGAEASNRLLAERGNLEAMIAHGLQEDKLRVAINAAIAYSEFMRFSGTGTTSLLDAAASAADQLGNVALHAQALFQLSAIAGDRFDLDTAQARFEEAQPLFEQVGDLHGQADCLLGLGEIALRRPDLDTAQARFEEARPLYKQISNLHGQANCIKGLGDIALERDDLDTAQARFEEARPLYKQISNLHGQANCIKGLGDIALKRPNLDTAQARFEEAQPLFEQVGDLRGQADCIRGLGDIALERDDYDTAQARYQQAQQLHEQVGNVLDQANCIMRLGDVARVRSDLDTAQARYEEAQPLYEQVGQILGQANCIQGLGDIARARSDHPTALAHYEEALALNQRIRVPYSIGSSHLRLARIAESQAERHQHVQAARTAWTSIGRADLVEELEDEFGED
jgi:tetratricopeptide (TPR) repeat protein